MGPIMMRFILPAAGVLLLARFGPRVVRNLRHRQQHPRTDINTTNIPAY
jgi:hypothetical protein